MNELIKITNDNGKQLVSARELHEFLGLKKRFSSWIHQYIKEDNDYMFVKDEDFTSVLSSTVVNNGANRELQDYAVTISMAKEISMVTNTDKGKEARRYFIDCEKKLKEIANSPSYQIEDPIARAKRWIEEQEERQKLALENEQQKEIIKEITTHALTIEDSRKVINKLVRTMAMVNYHGNFKDCWSALYTKYNYLCGTNIKNRKRAKGESLLSVLNEDETYKMEEIVKSWCVDNNIDVDKELKL